MVLSFSKVNNRDPVFLVIAPTGFTVLLKGTMPRLHKNKIHYLSCKFTNIGNIRFKGYCINCIVGRQDKKGCPEEMALCKSCGCAVAGRLASLLLYSSNFYTQHMVNVFCRIICV